MSPLGPFGGRRWPWWLLGVYVVCDLAAGIAIAWWGVRTFGVPWQR